MISLWNGLIGVNKSTDYPPFSQPSFSVPCSWSSLSQSISSLASSRDPSVRWSDWPCRHLLFGYKWRYHLCLFTFPTVVTISQPYDVRDRNEQPYVVFKLSFSDLHFDTLNWWQALLISSGIALTVGLLIHFPLRKWLRNRAIRLYEKDKAKHAENGGIPLRSREILTILCLISQCTFSVTENSLCCHINCIFQAISRPTKWWIPRSLSLMEWRNSFRPERSFLLPAPGTSTSRRMSLRTLWLLRSAIFPKSKSNMIYLNVCLTKNMFSQRITWFLGIQCSPNGVRLSSLLLARR